MKSTLSLRPKTYKREELAAKLNDDDLFFAKSINTWKTGNFNEIDNKIQLDKFERFIK
jgi:hypothetical protein